MVKTASRCSRVWCSHGEGTARVESHTHVNHHVSKLFCTILIFSLRGVYMCISFDVLCIHVKIGENEEEKLHDKF